MKENLTEIVFILDRSGSMSGLEKDTIGGYNSFLAKQQEVDGEARVTTVLFDDEYEVLHDGVELSKVVPITHKEYFARGNTALLDAVGKTIYAVGVRLSNTAEEERPGKVIFVITTDGEENSSRSFTYEKVREMITHQEKKYGWEFLFLGANIDAHKEAGILGIKASRSSSYVADAQGTGMLYAALANSVASIRTTGELAEGWNSNLGTSKKGKK